MVELQNVLDLRERANDKIFTQLEDAVTLAMEPLGKMFSAVGLPPSQILHRYWLDRADYPPHIRATLIASGVGFVIGNAVAVAEP